MKAAAEADELYPRDDGAIKLRDAVGDRDGGDEDDEAGLDDVIYL